ncbi:hypothetical protein [Okeania sp. SIO3I5]|uniref:hypothetical protein n=1 Tax=Okeania sp. SIO3I5 TaxID=2607805 RepID=UPI0035C92A1C
MVERVWEVWEVWEVGSCGKLVRVGSWFVWEEITKLMYLRHSSAELPIPVLNIDDYPQKNKQKVQEFVNAFLTTPTFPLPVQITPQF